eukprot:TRINITY_DN15882_c0_g1_i4.p1 TRINITY_DN15882_c0_g1~~TRINITY_DN15882_c0_g1_i4.p1  ORF type:complete len:432 (+),score=92.26 TRINITY_DN15882_c0_g1_i4:112-1296(+)
MPWLLPPLYVYSASSAKESLSRAASAHQDAAAAARRAARFCRLSLSEAEPFISWHDDLPELARRLERLLGRDASARPRRDLAAAVYGALICPHLDVEGYLAHLTKYARCSPVAWPLAFEYLARLERRGGVWVDSETWQRLTLTALAVAAKVVDDVCFCSSSYALIGGVARAEMACMERRFLQLIDWDLLPPPELQVLTIAGTAASEQECAAHCCGGASPASFAISSQTPSSASACDSLGPPTAEGTPCNTAAARRAAPHLLGAAPQRQADRGTAQPAAGGERPLLKSALKPPPSPRCRACRLPLPPSPLLSSPVEMTPTPEEQAAAAERDAQRLRRCMLWPHAGGTHRYSCRNGGRRRLVRRAAAAAAAAEADATGSRKPPSGSWLARLVSILG